MKQFFPVAVLTVGCALAGSAMYLRAQSNAGTQQGQQPNNPPPKPAQDSNPFPEDTNSIPVMPNANSPGTPALPVPEDAGSVTLPNAEGDPVHSPDDAEGAASSESSSSSNSGLDNLLKPPPDTGKPGKHGKDDADAPVEHHEDAKEDESVGSYYLDQKNWKAALSRLSRHWCWTQRIQKSIGGWPRQQRHLGICLRRKAHYQKLVEYDPDSSTAKRRRSICGSPRWPMRPRFRPMPRRSHRSSQDYNRPAQRR